MPAPGRNNPLVLTQVIYRVVGAPPPPGATRQEQLRWVRRFYRLGLVAVVVVVVLALVGEDLFLWIVAAVAAMVWLSGLAVISASIRRPSAGRG